MITTRMSAGWRLAIPVEIRQALGLKEGDSVLWEIVDGEARLTSRAARLSRAQALFQKYVPADSPSIADELIAERRGEVCRE